MVFLRAAALGLATGSRSTLGLTSLALSTPPPRRFRRSRSWANNPWTARLAVLASAAELVNDKLPHTPSRLEPAGFAPRVVFGALCGGVLVHREGRSGVPTAFGALVGAAGATAATQAGATWRQIASRKFGHDLPGALIEDAAAILTATAAVKL